MLGDETELPIGIRRVRRAVTPRSSRTIVTPPGDVPAGPARARRGPRARLGAIVGLLVLAVVIVGLLMLFQPFGSAQSSAVRVTIAQGASARDIGNQLSDAGVVSSGLLFSIRAMLAGKRGDLRSGPVTLHKSMTYGAAIDALTKKPVVSPEATIDVTIPEGKSRRETAALIKGKGLEGSYMTASKRFSGRLDPFAFGAPKGTRSTEGFLFPATYELRAGAPVSDLVDKQLAAFKQDFAGIDLTRAKRKNLTAYDVLIIGSMVEREAQLASERPKIAAVIYNRLHDGTPLGIDATIRYALDDWTQPLKESQLQIDSPYNTRTHKGLPPTPIGNPGLASLRAAAAPAHVSYRYYVVKPGTCGQHAFSSTFAQFERDSARYTAARDAAGGKSPTTC
ncbi:MAG TPA: endolytic transglycosylase MltG [Solirubrobacteraceae bacterium]